MMEQFGSFESDDSDSSKDSEKGTNSKSKARHVGSFARFVAKEPGSAPKESSSDDTIWRRATPDKPVENPSEQVVEPTAVTEVNVPLDEVTPDEERTVAERLVDAHKDFLEQEQPATGTPQEAAHVSHAALLDTVGERLQSDSTSPEDAVTQATVEVSQHIENYVAPLAETYPAVTAAEVQDFPLAAVQGGTEQTAASNTTQVPETPLAGGSGGETPPPPVRNPNLYPPIPGPATTEQAPRDPNMISIADAEYFSRQAESRGLIFGGALGYLIGKRRGRIKTERRMGAVQRKLEKQVEALDTKLTGAERQVRTLATEKFETVNETGQKQLLEQMRVTVPEAKPAVAVPRQEAKVSRTITKEQAPKVQPPEVVEATIRLKSMTTKQLLMVSERVVIEGRPLKEIFETKQITEPGLRHILTEYVRGGDVKQALAQELAIKEMTYERDPQVRDRIAGALAAKATDAAGVVVTDDNKQTASTSKSKSKKDAIDPAEKQRQAQAKALARQRNVQAARQAFERAWVAVVVLLAVIATILYFR